MVDAIAQEIEWQKAYINHEKIDTIYFGGGTPSILDSKDLERLLKSVSSHYKINPNPEITLEANPDDLSIKKLKELKMIGINRLSIGIQSFHEKTLLFIHRAHSGSEAINCLENARKTGFDNLSADLIFSIPGHSIQNLESDIARILDLNPEHISIYSLTIEEKTVFGNWQKKGKLMQLSDIESASQFDLIMSKLEENQFEQYEISNFCRDGHYARHNTAYWKNTVYLGVGPGAHSFNGKSRQFNVSNNHKYMKAIEEGRVPFELDLLDNKSLANEYLLTSLRTKWGCDLGKLSHDFHYQLETNQNISQWVNKKYLFKEDNKLYLTRKGKFVADEVISDLFWI